MSFLAPLYFLGALAVAGPILFHLIRRQPRGEVEFSSLMFLEKTPPRLTRRSRLENLPLLLLRCAAICMLALAFARPYLPMSEGTRVEGAREAIVLLVDSSASMRQAGYWQQVMEQANLVIEDAPGNALISVIGFNDQQKTELSLLESAELVDETRSGAAKDALGRIEPTWRKTDLGTAIRFAADQSSTLGERVSGGEESGGLLKTRVVLLSDLQSGGQVQSLQGYQWPEHVWLDIVGIGKEKGNASLRVVPRQVNFGEDDAEERRQGGEKVRVQVTHHGEAETNQFQLRFDGSDKEAMTVQVPPGQTRYVSVELPQDLLDVDDEESDFQRGDKDSDDENDNGNDSDPRQMVLRLLGDEVDFDNEYCFVRARRDQQRVLFLGEDQSPIRTADEARKRLSFFASQLPWSDTTRNVTFAVVGEEEVLEGLDPEAVPLLISGTIPTDERLLGNINRYVELGGRVLFVLDRTPRTDQVTTLAKLLDSPELSIEGAETKDYALIGAVDFQSPLIAPLSDPGVNDFSNIRVWKHQVVSGLSDRLSTPLRLDTGAPFLIQRDAQLSEGGARGGKVWVLTSGWQPDQSQFALATKFVPIMLGILGPHRQEDASMILVGQKVGTQDEVADGPGFRSGEDGQPVAVNLDPQESETTRIDIDRFSQLGVVVSSSQQREQEQEAKRAMRDVELESRQGWWQWLILGTLGLLAAETFLSGRREIQNVDE